MWFARHSPLHDKCTIGAILDLLVGLGAKTCDSEGHLVACLVVLFLHPTVERVLEFKDELAAVDILAGLDGVRYVVVDAKSSPGISRCGKIELQFQLAIALVGDIEHLACRLTALHQLQVSDAGLHREVELHIFAEACARGNIIGLSCLHLRCGTLAECYTLKGV